MKTPFLLLLSLIVLVSCSQPASLPAPATVEIVRVPANVAVASSTRAPAARPQVGTAAPDFRYEFADGRSASLTESQGKLVIVNFWATWCLPCRQELPAFSAVLAERDDVIFVGVNRNETPQVIVDFVDELQIRDLTMVTNFDGDIADAYGVTNLPTTVFIDARGQIGSIHLGALDADAIRASLDALKEPES